MEEEIQHLTINDDVDQKANASPKKGIKDKTSNMPPSDGSKFEPVDLENTTFIDSGLPPEIWTIVQSAPANFTPHYFLEVSRNLLENPNLTASYLSRAELSYTSFTDGTYNPEATHPHELAKIVKHMKADHQPCLIPTPPGYKLEWTVVRKLIPRNPKLDDALLQTCHLFTSTDQVALTEKDGTSKKVDAERYLVIYLPHVSTPEEIPFYHPKVQAVAILYTFCPVFTSPTPSTPGTLSLYYTLFPTLPLDNRMSRTALKMLQIIHKHSQGRMKGYTKRVHHDVLIPQKTFQDTYAELKGKYAQELITGWVEQTPPEKHVFEDLGIAAFLMELWIDMYGDKSEADSTNRRTQAQKNFPGFVDIGCGNGLLVYILNREGWHGWGFDARKRKTWDTFPQQYRDNLKELLLIPSILTPSTSNTTQTESEAPASHTGIFPPSTFIVSNHADELTPWTPLLAHLSSSPFISIPCCSHNFAGTRFRAPHHAEFFPSTTPSAKGKQVSAYTSLCSYLAFLTAEMGYVVEREFLRIPSTRNVAVVGRRRRKKRKESVEDIDDMMRTDGKEGGEDGFEDKLKFVRGIVEREMGGQIPIEEVGRLWVERGSGLMKTGKGGH